MKRNDHSDVTVIIPTLNEEENVAGVIRELSQMGCRNILIIDGNSRDRFCFTSSV
jgi:glycosyltransferase involved in cell wall biosynthesis